VEVGHPVLALGQTNESTPIPAAHAAVTPKMVERLIPVALQKSGAEGGDRVAKLRLAPM
jgi:hypothetical protein